MTFSLSTIGGRVSYGPSVSIASGAGTTIPIFGPVTIIADGDSIDAGAAGTGVSGPSTAFPALGSALFPSGSTFTVTNTGIAGAKITDALSTNLAANVYPLIGPAHASGRKVIYTCNLGTNDLVAGGSGSGTTAWTNMQTLVSDVLAHGADYVFISTLLPRNAGGTYMTDWDVYNGLLLAGYTGAGINGVIPFSLNPLVGVSGQQTKSVPYLDGTHPYETGQISMGYDFAATVMQYRSSLTVSSISPTSGTKSGGTAVTIIGSGFTAAPSAFVGSQATTSFTVVSDTKITCVTADADSSTMATGTSSNVYVIGAQNAGILPAAWTWT